jgi:hypothetical protein
MDIQETRVGNVLIRLWADSHADGFHYEIIDLEDTDD